MPSSTSLPIVPAKESIFLYCANEGVVATQSFENVVTAIAIDGVVIRGADEMIAPLLPFTIAKVPMSAA